VRGSVGGHLTDLKIMLFARSEEAKNIKNTCPKAWKIVSNKQIVKRFYNFQT
jgi:hypothetical protein